MADVELVIKVPEECYKQIQKHIFSIAYDAIKTKEEKKQVEEKFNVVLAIKNGTPLPKGHNIIDGTELNKYLDELIYAEQKTRLNGYETRTDIIERIKIKAEFLTIIEADEGSEE